MSRIFSAVKLTIKKNLTKINKEIHYRANIFNKSEYHYNH